MKQCCKSAMGSVVLRSCVGQARVRTRLWSTLAPSAINYASAPVYAAPFSVAGRKVQAVFQCRVKPDAYVRFQDTLPGHRPEDGVWDSEFGNDVVEWIVRDKEAVVPYRLQLRWA